MKNRRACFAERRPIYDMGPLPDLRELMRRALSVNGEKPVLRETRDGEIVRYSCKNIIDDVNALGTALIDYGFADAHIALVGENSYLWLISYMAVVCGVGVIVPLDKELTDGDLNMLALKGDARALIYAGPYRGAAGLLERARVRGFAVEPLCGADDADTLPGMIRRGRELLGRGDRRYLDRPIDRDKAAAILFTSGTTGANKGVMLSHKNICANIDNILKVTPCEPKSISMLPFHHTIELNCHVLPGILCGMDIYICASLRGLMDTMKLAKPGMSVVVPLFLETIYKTIWAEAKRQNRAGDLRAALKISNTLLMIGIDIRHVLFRQLKENLGGKLDLVICGGAAVDPEAVRGLYGLGIDVITAYGLTECSPVVSMNLKAHRHPEAVGKPFDTLQVTISRPDGKGVGEIYVKGDTVMLGYYQDEAATAATFDGPWLKTGDYGKLTGRKLLTVTGRKKNLIVLNNGKNVHPEEIEATIIRQLPYVKEALVYSYHYIVKETLMQTIAAALNIEVEEYFGKMDMENVEKLVAEDIRRINRLLPGYKQMHQLFITREDFLHTTTKKIVRHKVIDEQNKSFGAGIII
ncbi:MAG: Long-chain-fatty-acid--CoA ligase FadD15 [Firmicutes bacterium ADurb.Bin248]|nr:MAG: Long-chain-fatty-acid--CoA ligase FadD15 [Firmicutes bacterium ADurb.Bin248]HOF99653.1 AMP-binding protein [Clostridia bacterium]